MAYQFPGASPFIDAAPSAQLLDSRLRARARGLEPVGRIQTALGQACQVADTAQSEIIAEAKSWRTVLATALEAADAAIAHAEEGLGLAKSAVEPAPSTSRPARSR